MAMDEAAYARKRAEQRAQSSWFKLKEGDNSFRILPTPPTKRVKNNFYEYQVHRDVGPGKKTVRCGVHPVTGEGECWLCDVKVPQLRKKRMEERAKGLAPRAVLLMQVAKVDVETGKMSGPFLFTPAKTVGDQMLASIFGSRKRSYLDPETGYNLSIRRTGTGKNDTKYGIIEPDQDSTAVPAKIIDKVVPFEELKEVPLYSQAKQEAAYLGRDVAEDEEGEGEEEETPRGKRKPADDDDDEYETAAAVDDDDEPVKPKRRAPVEDDEDEAPPPKKRKPVEDDEDEPPVKPKKRAPVEDDEDEAPPPKRRAPVEDDDDEPPVKPKAKAAPVEDDDDEPPVKPKKRVVAEDDEDEPPVKPKKRAPVEDDIDLDAVELDDDPSDVVDDDEPPVKSKPKAAPVEDDEDEPPVKPKKKAAPVEDDEPPVKPKKRAPVDDEPPVKSKARRK